MLIRSEEKEGVETYQNIAQAYSTLTTIAAGWLIFGES